MIWLGNVSYLENCSPRRDVSFREVVATKGSTENTLSNVISCSNECLQLMSQLSRMKLYFTFTEIKKTLKVYLYNWELYKLSHDFGIIIDKNCM